MNLSPIAVIRVLLTLIISTILVSGCAGGAAPTPTPAPPAAAPTAAPPTVAPTKPAAATASPTTAPTKAAATATLAAPTSPAAVGTIPPTMISVGPTAVEAESAGKELFEANCVACHGPNGAGGLKIGNATSADLQAPQLEDAYNNNDALIRRAILQGLDENGDPLDPEMPRFQGKLTNTQVDEIIAYLKTLHP